MDSIIRQIISEAINDLESKPYIDKDIDYEFTIYLDVLTGKYINDGEKALKNIIINQINTYFDQNKGKIIDQGGGKKK
jgi:hypothetical protein